MALSTLRSIRITGRQRLLRFLLTINTDSLGWWLGLRRSHVSEFVFVYSVVRDAEKDGSDLDPKRKVLLVFKRWSRFCVDL